MAKTENNMQQLADEAAAKAAEEAAGKAAENAAKKEAEKAAERAVIAACKAAIEPLTCIQPNAPEYGERYKISRAGQTGVLTAGHLAGATKAYNDPAVSLAEIRRALKPLSDLPIDHTVTNRAAALYEFPTGSGDMTGISIDQIAEARRLLATT